MSDEQKETPQPATEMNAAANSVPIAPPFNVLWTSPRSEDSPAIYCYWPTPRIS